MVKIRDSQVANRPVYVAIGVNLHGERHVLGMWIYRPAVRALETSRMILTDDLRSQAGFVAQIESGSDASTTDSLGTPSMVDEFVMV